MRHSRALVTTYIVGGAVLATILFAVGSGEGSGTAAAPAVAAGRVIAAGDRQAAIRRVYQAYAERSAGAEGGPVEIALDDFRIVAEDDFDDVAFFPDVATLASDWELAAVIDVRIEEGQPGREIRVRPEWRPVEDPPPEDLLGRPASEIVGPGGDRFASRRRVEWLTSYRVEVRHDGLEKSYRAAAMWLHEPDGALAFAIADNVIPDVELAVDDGQGPGGLLGDRYTVAGRHRTPRELEAGQCTPERIVRRIGQPGSVFDAVSAPPTDGRPSYVAVHACSCAADCSARCVARTEASYDGCRGVLSKQGGRGRQRAVAITYDVDQSTPPGLPAACSAHLSCAILDCRDGLCGDLRVRLVSAAGGLRLEPSGGSGDADSLGHSFSCGACSPS